MAESLLIRSVTFGLLVLTAGGCSVMRSAPPPVDPPAPAPAPAPVAAVRAPVPPPYCAIAQRDLTRPWNRRSYWCRPDGLAMDGPGAGGPGVARPARMTVEAAPASATAARPRPEVTPVADPGEPRAAIGTLQVAAPVSPAPGQPAASGDHRAQVTSRPAPDAQPSAPGDTVTYTIPFARTAVALGPLGQDRAQGLVAAARAHCERSQAAKCVLLQGATLGPARETNPEITDPDEFAVGRALAVRQVLERGGIARERIKILRRDPSRVARCVEVRLDG